jgi:hypothetical protein
MMSKHGHYAIQRNTRPLWWYELPRKQLIQFKTQVDEAIRDKSPNVILTWRKKRLICIAALSETGLDLANGMAMSVAQNYTGQSVEIIAITPANYDTWFVPVKL